MSVCAACGSSFTGGGGNAGAPADGGGTSTAGDDSGGSAGHPGAGAGDSGGDTNAGAGGASSGGSGTAGSGTAGSAGSSAGAGGSSGKGGTAGSAGTGGATDCKTLEAEYAPLLEKARDALKARASIAVMVQGHTDNVGTDDHNQKLSAARADPVRQWLAANGIAPNRLTSRGFGKTAPVADNTSDAGRARNRRVELVREGCK